MRISKMLFKTFREAPADAEIKSHKLLVRGGYIKKQGMGSYIYLPLALRVIDKINNVIREELDNAGCSEVLMPMLLSQDVYEHRITKFGSSMFRFQDRNGKDFCLGPTHEEVFTNLVKDNVTSYKQLPMILYQIQTKFRDEVRPRFGLQRTKEFIMKDAYSYDRDMEGLNKSFNLMSDTYTKIFNRLGLDFVKVEADNGAMGGSGSREFMVKNDVGEDEIIVCHDCGYAANTEKAECVFKEEIKNVKQLQKSLVKTPSVKTIDELCEFLKTDSKQFVKVVAYNYDKGVVLALVRGDREVEEVKLINHLNTVKLEMASAQDIMNIGSVAGFIGATEEIKNCVVVADNEIKNMVNFVTGGNKEDYHYINVNLGDLKVDDYIDLRKAVKGDVCPRCGKTLDLIRGIEVGHIFKNETTYTEALDCKYLDENGKSQLMQMGCYGIGVTRTLSSIVEQYGDENGIVWPEIVAPYQVYVTTANWKDTQQSEICEKLYNKLLNKGVEVLFDDRKENIGLKLKDAELIGIPKIVVIGRDIVNGNVEVIDRKTLEKEIVDINEFIKNY